ncbi:uncharacterized protein VTP21DRAFT_11053 [Calcarisporiella thermophila]|uniref:uncharacterized protein n=1 Tax=Calcarisporiella thermophila TaxID=911321 RepID=UPI0037428951
MNILSQRNVNNLPVPESEHDEIASNFLTPNGWNHSSLRVVEKLKDPLWADNSFPRHEATIAYCILGIVFLNSLLAWL